MAGNERSLGLERRLKELEEEVKKLKEPLESTLMDVRELISNLENPFNYVANLMDLEKLKEELKEASAAKNKPGLKESSTHHGPSSSPASMSAGVSHPQSETSNNNLEPVSKLDLEKRGFLGVLACACILLKLLGRENTLRFLGSRLVRQLAPSEVIDRLSDAVDFLLKHAEPHNLYLPDHASLTYESLLAAAYVVSMMAVNPGDDRLFVTLLLGMRETSSPLPANRR